MAFQARLASHVATLDNPDTGERADIAVDKGFNCYNWAIREGQPGLLYADPQFLEGSSPTRTGIPILFPFPNRIRAGRYTWAGQEYQLPINDPARKNAIHGFACRRPWRVVDQGATAGSAWVTGEFQGSRDAADCRDLWPADYCLRITYRLLAGRLRTEVALHNPDQRPLPFGLGFHHYFSVGSGDCAVEVPARQCWELRDTLPTGKRLPVTPACDLRSPRPFAGLALDDVLCDLPAQPDLDGLCPRGAIHRPGGNVMLLSSPAFREAVVFTPPHRQAFCIEPYTCVTDAINLEQQGVSAGLLVLEPGQNWTAAVEMRVDDWPD